MKNRFKTIAFMGSAVLILVATVLFYFRLEIAPWLLSFGVLGYGAVSFTSPYPGKSLRGKRLFNMQVLAVMLMAVSTYLMFVGRMEWVATLLVSAILILYSTVAMSAAYKKEEEEGAS